MEEKFEEKLSDLKKIYELSNEEKKSIMERILKKRENFLYILNSYCYTLYFSNSFIATSSFFSNSKFYS